MSNVSVLVEYFAEDVLEEGVFDHVTKGWGTNIKATLVGNASLSKIQKNYERWESLKKDLLENIEKHKDVEIDTGAISSNFSTLFNWRAIFILKPSYYSKIANSIKTNTMAELTNFDLNGRDVYAVFGNPKKVSDLKKAVVQFDTNFKALVTLEKTHTSPVSVRGIVAGATGDFAIAINRLIHAST